MIDRKWIGHELPASVLPIERTRLQFFAKVIGETDPVYTDAAAARDAGYPDLPAPPTFLFAAELDSGAAFRLIDNLADPDRKAAARRAELHVSPTGLRRRHRDRPLHRQRHLRQEERRARVRREDLARHQPTRRTGGRAALGARLPALTEPTGACHEFTPFDSVSVGRRTAGPRNCRRSTARRWRCSRVHPATTTRFTSTSTFARRAGMPDVFAHGMLGLAWLARLVTGWAPQTCLRSFNAPFRHCAPGPCDSLDRAVIEKLEHDGERCVRIEVRPSTSSAKRRSWAKRWSRCPNSISESR